MRGLLGQLCCSQRVPAGDAAELPCSDTLTRLALIATYVQTGQRLRALVHHVDSMTSRAFLSARQLVPLPLHADGDAAALFDARAGKAPDERVELGDMPEVRRAATGPRAS